MVRRLSFPCQLYLIIQRNVRCEGDTCPGPIPPGRVYGMSLQEDDMIV